ncbi:MAG: glycerol-3-phosphate dehydrogenase, partial [Ruminococcus sp.]|nr:glycerol-3-phosphate dehydrogenase [Ruminococcus sp.]
MKISVLGCGRWGSCIAWYLDKIGHDVLSCGLPDAPEFIQLKTHHCNDYLVFPETIEVSADLGYAVNRAEVIVISISSQYLRSYFQEIAQYALEGKTIVLCMKGVEATTGKRLSEIVGEFVDESKTPVAVWVGPGHPQDYVKGIPNCMVIDSNNREVKERLVKAFTSELIRFYIGKDLIGSEIGAAAKNVIGIAAGILDGLGYTSLKGGLMARGAQEIARLIEALGGNKMSAFGLCHLGDYEATLFSPWSHNRRYGEAFAKG